MGQEDRKVFEHLSLKKQDGNRGEGRIWVIIEGGNGVCDSTSTGSSFEDSMNSVSSFMESSLEDSINSVSSSDSAEDDVSSSLSYTSPSSTLSSATGPLYQLSELMAQLPIKRGLSNFYQGKSQSFTSLASVKSLEDLPKKGYPCKMKMKSCKSFVGGLMGHCRSYSPKATISKKASRGSFLSSLSKRGG